MKKQASLSIRTHQGLYNTLEKIAEERNQTVSEIVRSMVVQMLDKYNYDNCSPVVQEIIDNKSKYVDALEVDWYLENENLDTSTRVKKATYIEYMDRFIANIYLSNRDYMSDEKIGEMIRQEIDTLKSRASMFGYEDEYNARVKEPVKHAKRFLKRKAIENDAWADWLEFTSGNQL